MKKLLSVCAVLVLSLLAGQAWSLKMFSIGVESLGTFPVQSQILPAVTNLNAYSVNVGVSSMGPKRLFLIGDLRLKVGFLQTNDFSQSRPDANFFAGDVMLGLGYRILNPQGFGIDLAPTLSAFADFQFDAVMGTTVHYGPALGLNAFLKLGKNFGVGIRGIAKYSIAVNRVQPSVQVGIVLK